MAARKQRCTVRQKILSFSPHPVNEYSALADALAEEVKPFGIKVYTIMPGGMRTQGINNINWTRGNPSLSEDSPKAIPEYNETNRIIADYFRNTNGHETGDPLKVANVVVDLVHREGMAAGRQPDVSLFLGSDCKRDVINRCRWVLDTLDAWNDVVVSTDISP